MKLLLSKLFLLSLTVIGATAHAETKLSGNVSLNKQLTHVTVNFSGRFNSSDQITIGKDSYLISSAGANGFNGSLVVKTNGARTTDNSIQILMGSNLASIKRDPAAAAKELELSNKAEFQCKDSDNALIIISNNLNGTMMANCIILQ